MRRHKSASFLTLFRPVAVACSLALIMVSFSKADSVTFAQVIQGSGSMQQWTISNSGDTTTVAASGNALFLFYNVTGLPFSGPQEANFSLSATTTQIGSCAVACGGNDQYSQPGYSGMFSFTDTALGTNLLTGTFSVTGSPSTTGAQFSSTIGSSGASFNASTAVNNLSEVILTSDYLNFAGQTQEVASFSLSSLVPVFATGTVNGNRAYPAASAFEAAGSGTFSSDPGPSAATPEPTTWSLLIGGSLVAIGLIRRRITT